MRVLIAPVIGALSAAVLMAQEPAALETEARAIDAMLIAPCCFSQQVSVHQSPAADEIRRDVRARLAAGQARQQILQAYVAQYGTRILAEPPATGFNRTLYVLPFALFVATLALVIVAIQRVSRHRHAADGVPERTESTADIDEDVDKRVCDELRDLD